MAEHIIGVARSCRRACNCFCAIDVGIVVHEIKGAVARRVLDLDAFGTNQLAAPFGVEIKLADGKRVGGVDLGCGIELAVLADRGLVKDDVIEAVRLRHGFVGVPTDQVVVNPFATDVADLLAIIGPELIGLRCAGVLDGVVRAVVRMQSNLILCQTPLCIERYVVGWHGRKAIRIAGTRLVVIPTLENVTVELRCNILVLDIGLILDVRFGMEPLTCSWGFLDSMSFAVHEDTIVIDNVVAIAGVIEV